MFNKSAIYKLSFQANLWNRFTDYSNYLVLTIEKQKKEDIFAGVSGLDDSQ